MRNLAPLLLLMAGASVAPIADRAPHPAPGGGAPADFVVYEAQPGDRLSKLAERHFLNPEDWRKALALNGLSSDALAAGARVRLDPAWLRRTSLDAQVIAFRGSSVVRRDGGEMPVERGMTVREGDQILTGAIGFVTLRLSDGSELAIPTNSQVRFLRLRGYELGNILDRRLLIERGSLDSKVTPMRRPGSRYEVTTPVSVAAVRGTEFRVSFTPGDSRSITEVIEGRVGVLALGPARPGELLVPSNHGVVTTGAGVGRLEAMLPPPEVDGPPPVIQDDLLAFRLVPVAGVAAWRLELAADPAFTDRVAEQVSPTGEFDMGALPPGLYHARVRAISRAGIGGRPAAFTISKSDQLALVADTPGSGRDAGKEPPAPDGTPPASLGDPPQGLARLVADIASAAEEIPPIFPEVAGLEEGDASDESLATAGLVGGPAAAEGGGGGAVALGANGNPFAERSSGPGRAMVRQAPPNGRAGPAWGAQGGALPFAPWAPGPGTSVPGLLPSPQFPPPGQSLPGALVPEPALPTTPGAGLVPLLPSTGGEATTPPVVAVVVPEPSTWATMIAGFGLVGLFLRRALRRRAGPSGARG